MPLVGSLVVPTPLSLLSPLLSGKASSGGAAAHACQCAGGEVAGSDHDSVFASQQVVEAVVAVGVGRLRDECGGAGGGVE